MLVLEVALELTLEAALELTELELLLEDTLDVLVAAEDELALL